MLYAVISLGVVCLALAVVVVILLRRPQMPQDSQSALMLKADMQELTQSMGQLREGLQTQLTERLDKSNDQMAAQFQASAKIIRDVTQKLTELDKTNQQVGNIATELKTLQNVLQNP